MSSTHSPVVDSIAVKRRGAVRKAKLYYLRERTGKSSLVSKSVLTKIRFRDILMKGLARWAGPFFLSSI